MRRARRKLSRLAGRSNEGNTNDLKSRLRAMKPLFSAHWYLGNGGRMSEAPGGMPALRDYVSRGHLLGISPHPLFDPHWYQAQAGAMSPGMSPLEHYLLIGAARGLSPHPLFDPRSKAAKAAPAGANPLIHYLNSPETWHLSPNPLFSGRYYLRTHKDVARREVHPLLHYVQRGDLESRRTHRHFDPASYRSFAALPRQVNTLAHYLANQDHRFSESTAKIHFPSIASPDVSVVVPVHGKWAYTRECLRALAKVRADATFEVVVVDDASPDDTAERLAAIRGVRVVSHATNTGYVGACNSGIAAARGHLIVLLNNDTRVDAGWLDPLVERMSDPTIGLVGSKLVYPTGLVQEAGGIIFSDASGHNYGKFGKLHAPDYNYARDVDYCSGASIMLRARDLEKLGGLSEELAPAYYDDADLAFGIRALGLRVVYEPRSLVMHDEGVSHGTDETQGVKAYQVINREKFRAKWQTELENHFPNDPALLAKAARRLHGSDVVVVLDHYVPRPDEDAGSVRMRALLEELCAQGHAVIFVPRDRSKSNAYGEALQNLGIEVLHDARNLRDFLLPLQGRVSAVVMSRFRTAMNNIEAVRSALPDVPIIFDTVDLHHLRLERESALVTDGPPPSLVRAVRDLELAMVRSCETTVVVSAFEQDLLRELVPGADVRVLSTVHAKLQHVAANPVGRDGLLFVGSFSHTPNADALKWFVAEVLPLVREKYPDVGVNVVGRDPLPELLETAPPGVKYLGWVADLEPLYAQTRISIAPLRFGAGVKGKIGEAMTHGVPVVTTPVGAEGMGLVDGVNALVAGDATEFAHRITTLLGDDDLWSALSHEGQQHIDRTLGSERFAADVADLFASRPGPQS